jgi:alpha-L-fucosidase
MDADAVIEPLADAGMRGVVLTCKHHDGYCLWPTSTTQHSIRSSPWRAGKGDVVRELSEAARRKKMGFGVYLSPWDRNAPQYGKPEYVAMYRQQLRELLTNYGPIFEVWHDGANGGDGYYGGARERRTIDKRTYYDWPRTWELIRSLQPDAVVFSDVGPDVRWVGNERGVAGDPCWAAFNPVGADGGPASPGNIRERESPTGHRNGALWLPAECPVSIRPGWFYHEAEDARVKTPAQLIDLFYKSNGRGANLLLNVPPDKRGLLPAPDIAALRAFGAYRRAVFGKDLARGARTKAAALVDGRADTWWEGSGPTPEATFRLSKPVSFSVIRIREAIRFGQRIDSVAVDRDESGAWQEIATATSIGARRLIRLEKPVTASSVRLRVTKTSASAILTEFALFAEPA